MTSNRTDRARTTRRAVASTTLAACLAITGCAAGGTEAETPSTPVALPDTPVGEQAEWVIDTVNADEAARANDVEARLASEFLEQVSAAELIEVFEQVRAAGPWMPTAVESAQAQAIVTIESSNSDPIDVQLSIDEDERLNGLVFAPAAEPHTPAADWDELRSNVEGLDAAVTMVVTPVDGDPLLDVGDHDPMPLGSVFKLYVLGAVVDAVASGALSWDEQLTVTDDLRSLPSGELQDAPAGTVVTVRDAAQKMIEISDNTATDILIDRVGADAVERAFADMGHSDPERNVPLLTTRALFQLGWGNGDQNAQVRERWRDAGASERQRMLDELPAGAIEVPAETVTDPVWEFGLDWFATADDIIAAHTALQELAATEAGAPIADILTANNGLGLEEGEGWASVAFKGGSAPGELALTWYAEREDGERFVVTLQAASDDQGEIDQRSLVAQAQDAFNLLADG